MAKAPPIPSFPIVTCTSAITKLSMAKLTIEVTRLRPFRSIHGVITMAVVFLTGVGDSSSAGRRPACFGLWLLRPSKNEIAQPCVRGLGNVWYVPDHSVCVPLVLHIRREISNCSKSAVLSSSCCWPRFKGSGRPAVRSATTSKVVPP